MKEFFQAKISNEDVAELPLLKFSGKIVVVEDEQACEKAAAELMRVKKLGFDTETRPSFKPGILNSISLLQLSTENKCFLFRLNKVKLSGQLLKLLENPSILKIGADVTNDIKGLIKLKPFTSGGFVDLQKLVDIWNIEEKSLRKMCALVLGGRISKAQRLSNWESSTLTDPQKIYAATDAWSALMIYERMMKTGLLNPEFGMVAVTPDQNSKKKYKARKRPMAKKNKLKDEPKLSDDKTKK